MKHYFVHYFVLFCLLVLHDVFMFGQSPNPHPEPDHRQVSQDAVNLAFKRDRDAAAAAMNRFSKMMQDREFDFMNGDVAPFFRAAILFHALEDENAQRWLYAKGMNSVFKIPDSIERDRNLVLLAQLIPKNDASQEFFEVLQAICGRVQLRGRIIALNSFGESGMQKMPTWKELTEQKLIVSPTVSEDEIPKEWIDGVKLTLDKFATISNVDIQAVCVAELVRMFAAGSNTKKKMVCRLLMEDRRISEDVRKRWSREFDEGNDLRMEITGAQGLVLLRIDQSKEHKTNKKSNPGALLAARSALKNAVKQANELDVNDGRGKMLLAVADRQIDMGELEDADLALVSALKYEMMLADNDVMLHLLANRFLKTKNHIAIEICLNAISSTPENATVKNMMWEANAELVLQTNDYVKAREYANKITTEKERRAILERIDEMERSGKQPTNSRP